MLGPATPDVFFDAIIFQDKQYYNEPDGEAYCLRCWTSPDCAAWNFENECILVLTEDKYTGDWGERRHGAPTASRSW